MGQTLNKFTITKYCSLSILWPWLPRNYFSQLRHTHFYKANIIFLIYYNSAASPIWNLLAHVLLILIVEVSSHLLTTNPIRIRKSYGLTTTLNEPSSIVGWTMVILYNPNRKTLFWLGSSEGLKLVTIAKHTQGRISWATCQGCLESCWDNVEVVKTRKINFLFQLVLKRKKS